MYKTKGKIKLLVLILLLGGFCFGNRALGLTDEQVNEEIKSLNSEIAQNKSRLEDLEKQKEAYAQSIKEKQQEAASLKNQLSILDNRIAEAEIEIENVKGQISEVNLEMKKTEIEIENKNNQIDREKSDIANIIRLLYKEGEASALEILLMNNSLAEFLSRVKYLEDMNGEMGIALENLKKYKSELDRHKIDLEAQNEELANLKEDLDRTKIALAEEKNNKSVVLEETKNSEKEYQELLASAKREQDRAAADIVDLERTVREKIEALNREEMQFNDNGLIWPVSKNVVTTYFHDPEYPFRYIFEHPAVDIRAAQGSQIKAAASGYVARVKLEGKAYGYIMIIHGDGLSTVYGHVSKTFVSEDDYVVQGQAIALSGGLPGTTGAGRLTTGAHLHFEVRKDGVPVDPMDYLP